MAVNINITLAETRDSATEGFDTAYDWGYLDAPGENIPTGLNLSDDDGETNYRNPSVFDYNSKQISYPSSTGLDVRKDEVADDF